MMDAADNCLNANANDYNSNDISKSDDDECNI
jgi:hypothetical protein